MSVDNTLQVDSDDDLWSVGMYGELQRIARGLLGREKDLTLESREIVHKAWQKIRNVKVKNHQHLMRLTVKAMREVILDYIRSRTALKRGGAFKKQPMFQSAIPGLERVDSLELFDALEKLNKIDERAEQVVMLRFFAGMTQKEIAESMQVSERTIRSEWKHAKVWLRGELSDD